MATNALIGIQRPDGTIETIRCWMDGYPDHMGPMLAENYDTQEKVDALLGAGDLGFLEESVKTSICQHRDRKTDWETCKPKTCRNLGAFLHESRDYDYSYLFHDGKWNFYDPDEK